MIGKRQIFFISIIFSILLISYLVLIIFSGNTFVSLELDAVRGHSTFVTQNEFTTYNKYYDNHRDADNYYYHVRMNAEAIRSQHIGSGFVTNILNGYPIFFGIENLKGISFYVGRILYAQFEVNPLMAAIVGSDISLIFWSIICVFVSILICHALSFNLLQSIATIFILSPLSNIYVYESFLMSYTALLFLILAFLWRRHMWICTSLVFSSTFLTLISNDYHAYLYFPIFGLCIVYLIIKERNYRLVCVSSLAVLLAILSQGYQILQIFNFLSSTLQDTSNSSHLASRSYHPFIISALFDWPIIEYFKKISKDLISNETLNILYPSVTLKFTLIPGLIMLYLLIFDRIILNNKIFIWISVLLLAGPLHYLIGIFIPPYAAETSSRLHASLNIFLNLYVLNIIVKYKERFFEDQRIKMFVIGLLSIYLMQFLLITFRDLSINEKTFWMSGIFYMLSLVVFLLAHKRKSMYFFYFSLLILPLSNMFGPSGMQTLRPISTEVINKTLVDVSGVINSSDTVLIAGSAKKNTIHPNLLLGYGVNVIDAYLTPYPKNITNLLVDIKSHNYDLIKSDQNILKNVRYYDTRKAFQVKNVNRISDAEKRFIDLFGVNLIIMPKDVNLKWPGVKFRKKIGNLRIYEYRNPTKYPKYVCDLEYVKKPDFDTLILLGPDVVITGDKNVIMHDSVSEDCPDTHGFPSIFEPNKTLFEIPQGILRTVIRYDRQLSIKDSFGKDIQFFECDVAFICLLIEEKTYSPLEQIYENK